MKEETIKTRRYTFTEEQFKEKLGLEGKVTFVDRDVDLHDNPRPPVFRVTTEEKLEL